MAKQSFRPESLSPFVTPLRLIVLFLCILAPTFCSIGCEGSRSDLSASKQPEDSAQADFDWAMERLRRAIETFTPTTSRGLRVRRDLSYELHLPDASQPNYTAQVTIKSKMFYKPGRRVSVADEDSEKNKARDNAFAEELLADDSEEFFETEGALPTSKPMIVESQIPAPRMDKLNVYELIRQDGRWQLETQPESELEQMWFDYAIQQ